MSASVSLENIKQLGIDLWYPHGLQHPLANQAKQFIYTPLPIVGAHCMVVRFFASRQVIYSSAPINKIYHGMLSVLELGLVSTLEQRVMELFIIGPSDDLNFMIQQQIDLWRPYTVLQLGMEQTLLELQVPVVQTYSPEHLASSSKDKAQAYKDLLNLRKIISGK